MKGFAVSKITADYFAVGCFTQHSLSGTMLDHNLPWCVLEGISTHSKGSWNLKDAPWGHSTIRHAHAPRPVIMRAFGAEYSLTGHPSKTKKVPRNWVNTLAFPLEKKFETKECFSKVLNSTKGFDSPIYSLILGCNLWDASSCRVSMQQLNPVGNVQPGHTKMSISNIFFAWEIFRFWDFTSAWVRVIF